MSFSDWLTLCGDLAAAIGLGFAWYAIRRGNENSSASSLITLYEALRQSWDRFRAADDEDTKSFQFAELANILEMACALCVSRVMVGVSHELLTEYLRDVMRVLDNSDDAKRRLAALVQTETTFKYIGLYLHQQPSNRQ